MPAQAALVTAILSEDEQVTSRRSSATWDEHLRLHFQIRDLLRVAAWRGLNFVGHEVMSAKDPVRMLDGSVRGDQWLPVITNRTGIPTDARPAKLTSMDFLFSFDDIGSRGIGRWLRLFDDLPRGLSTFTGVLDLEGATLEAHLAQVGIAFEMLGYDLLRESQASKSALSKAGIGVFARAVSSTVSEVLPFPAEQFPDRLRDHYVGVKHADQMPPDWEDLLLTYLQSIQIFRAWVATRLGMRQARLKKALEHDSISRRILEVASH